MRRAIVTLLTLAVLCGGHCCVADDGGEPLGMPAGIAACAAEVATNSAGALTPPTAVDEVTYILRVQDQHGEPVPGASFTFCSDTTCALAVSDADGVVTFTGAPFTFHVALVEAPEGYDDASVEAFTTDAQAAPMSVVIRRLD